MHDDWSYIRTAQVLGETGHVVFNGWATALLGWQLLPAALVVKFFGFSFTAVRLTTLLIAAPMTYLIHRCMVRCGIREWNATIGTLLLMLSPLVVPAVTLYISDIWGFFAIVSCLYCLLRALQAKEDHISTAWICTAILSNALTGTARQTGFLGILVMVPCALWLLRNRLTVLRFGVATCALGYVFVFGAIRWFKYQPYSVSYHYGSLGLRNLLHHPDYLIRPLLELALLLSPLLMLFLPAVRSASRPIQVSFLLSCAALAGVGVYAHHIHTLTHWLIPFDTEHGSIFSKNGSFVQWPIRGTQPQVIPEPIRLLFAAATFVGLLAWLVSLTTKRAQSQVDRKSDLAISWPDLAILTVPFWVAYASLLIPSLTRYLLIDRYLIPLVFVAMLYLLRYYQECMTPFLPPYMLPVALSIAAYSVVATHDSFAMYRAVLASANELRAAGVPRDQIDAGWEYNGWTQITEGGYVHTFEEGIQTRVPGGDPPLPPFIPRVCYFVIGFWMPDVHPAYTLSFDRDDCGGATEFTPIVYHRWMQPHTMTVYVVKDPPGNGPMPDFDSIQ